MDNYGKLQSKGERAEVIFCQTLAIATNNKATSLSDVSRGYNYNHGQKSRKVFSKTLSGGIKPLPACALFSYTILNKYLKCLQTLILAVALQRNNGNSLPTLCMKDLEKICMTVFSICIDYIFRTKICLPLLMHRKDRDLERRLGLAHFQSSQLR